VCGGLDGLRPHLELIRTAAHLTGLGQVQAAPMLINSGCPSRDGVQQGCNRGSNDEVSPPSLGLCLDIP
jgi:hypothetical protein